MNGEQLAAMCEFMSNELATEADQWRGIRQQNLLASSATLLECARDHNVTAAVKSAFLAASIDELTNAAMRRLFVVTQKEKQ